MDFYLLDRNFQNVLNNNFKQYFLAEFKNVKKELNANERGELNTYYLPSFIEYLNEYYMGISPLWSNILNFNRQKNRSTNSIVESWFKVVKHNIFPNKRKLRITEFITDMSDHLNGKVIEYNTLSRCRKVTRKLRLDIEKESQQQKKRLEAKKAEWKKTLKNNDKTYFDPTSRFQNHQVSFF